MTNLIQCNICYFRFWRTNWSRRDKVWNVCFRSFLCGGIEDPTILWIFTALKTHKTCVLPWTIFKGVPCNQIYQVREILKGRKEMQKILSWILNIDGQGLLNEPGCNGNITKKLHLQLLGKLGSIVKIQQRRTIFVRNRMFVNQKC